MLFPYVWHRCTLSVQRVPNIARHFKFPSSSCFKWSAQQTYFFRCNVTFGFSDSRGICRQRSILSVYSIWPLKFISQREMFLSYDSIQSAVDIGRARDSQALYALYNYRRRFPWRPMGSSDKLGRRIPIDFFLSGVSVGYFTSFSRETVLRVWTKAVIAMLLKVNNVQDLNKIRYCKRWYEVQYIACKTVFH